MSPLAEVVMINGEWIAIAAGVCSVVWAIVKFGDRLWGKVKKGDDVTQSIECQFEHRETSRQHKEMHEVLREMLAANRDMLRNQLETAIEQRNHSQQATERHQAIMSGLERIEASLKREG